MDIQQLLNQFLGSQSHNNTDNQETTKSNTNEMTLADKAKNIAQKATQGGLGGFAGGAVAGGLLTLLFSNTKVGSIASSAITYGGAAVLGAMAHKAYQNYQAGKSPKEEASISQQEIRATDNKLLAATATSSNGKPFGMTLVKGMIMAAKSDGHIDPNEQKNIFSEIEKLKLPANEKALILDAFTQPIDVTALASEIKNEEQAAQLYLISRLTINPDNPDEKKYLESMSSALRLPPELIAHLEYQAQASLQK